jgi:hypothetical protein
MFASVADEPNGDDLTSGPDFKVAAGETSFWGDCLGEEFCKTDDNGDKVFSFNFNVLAFGLDIS